MAAAGGVDRITAYCLELVGSLQRAGVQPEPLAILLAAHKRWGVITVAAKMLPVAEVWRLGVLLVDTDGQLWVAGRTTRAAERQRRSFQAASLEERRDIAATALKAGYDLGQSVNYDAARLDLAALTESPEADGVVAWHDDVLRVRWRAGADLAGAPTVEEYLSERTALLLTPPQRSTD